MTWQELQDQFRRQYSKLGSTREQLFHAWRSFHYDANVEMPDTYVTTIKQVAVLLGHREPQILEVFKNTVPNRLYWVLFPINNLREVVETEKRFLIKEKIYRQLAGQSSAPFMKLSDKKSKKAVSFDAMDILEKNSESMEKMTVLMDRMFIKLDQKNIPYKLEIYQRRRSCQMGTMLDRMRIGEGIYPSVEKEITVVFEVIDMVNLEDVVILGEENLEVEIVVILGEIIVGIEIEIIRIGGNLGQEKEEK